ncbi:MAG: hypothetical protein ACJ701_01475, partial [Nitrososphaera sp.]
GSLGKLDPTSGEVFYSPVEGCMICYSTLQYQVTDSHGPLTIPLLAATPSVVLAPSDSWVLSVTGTSLYLNGSGPVLPDGK